MNNKEMIKGLLSKMLRVERRRPLVRLTQGELTFLTHMLIVLQKEEKRGRIEQAVPQEDRLFQG